MSETPTNPDRLAAAKVQEGIRFLLDDLANVSPFVLNSGLGAAAKIAADPNVASKVIAEGMKALPMRPAELAAYFACIAAGMSEQVSEMTRPIARTTDTELTQPLPEGEAQ